MLDVFEPFLILFALPIPNQKISFRVPQRPSKFERSEPSCLGGWVDRLVDGAYSPLYFRLFFLKSIAFGGDVFSRFFGTNKEKIELVAKMESKIDTFDKVFLKKP